MTTLDLIRSSPKFRALLTEVERVAPVDSAVLIQGETGTGKEVIARAIHEASPRRNNRFGVLNYTAIPSALSESELFGHERGAFTGAWVQTKGRFQMADGGTLFLDGILDMPLKLQPKLLRVLQRLGSTHTMQANVREVAATNQDLEQLVAKKLFRSDLFYRLNVIPICLPQLRERIQDIRPLTEFFVAKFAAGLNKPVDLIPDEVVAVLQAHDWPGNIRELQNFIERAVLFSPGSVLRLPLGLQQTVKPNSDSISRSLADADREHILEILRQTSWLIGGQDGVAIRLGLPWTTLIYKIRKLSIGTRRCSMARPLRQLTVHQECHATANEQSVSPRLRAVTKSGTEFIISRVQAANNCVGTSRGAKRLRYRPSILSAALTAIFSVCACSQTQLATVSGTITDPSGAVVPSVSVTIVTQGTGLKRSALTDIAGEYRFAGLPMGNYSLRMEKTGFQLQVLQGVYLTSATEVIINSQLAIGDLSQQTTVSANVAGIDKTMSTINGTLLEQSVAELPLDNRDLFSAVALEPGVAPNPSSAPSLLSSGKSGQVAINGIRPSMTNVLIDGMDATDPVFGYSPAGASGFFLGLNELAKVNVLTQTFDAEYGGHGGAVIEMTTKSGSNQFHGSLWELYRGASLDAKNYFDLSSSPIPQFVRNQFGAGIGGPLKRDHTFFFVDYEGFREVQATTAIATVPNAFAHQGLLPSASDPAACTNANPGGCVAIPINPQIQPFLNLMPVSNGPANGDGTGELITANKGATREDHGMVRVDHNFSSTHSLFARYTIDDSSARVPYVGTPPGTYVPGFPAFHLARNQYGTVQDRLTFGPQWINELRFGVNRTTAATSVDNTHPGLSISLTPGLPFGMIDITGISLLGNNPSFPLGDYSTVYEVQDQLSRTVGRHTLKVGVEFRRLQYNGPLDFVGNGLYNFADLTAFGLQASSVNPALEFFLQGVPLSYAGVNPSNADPDRGYRETFASGFAQDFVRVSSRLTVNFGLRYDFYSNPTEVNGRLSTFLNPATDSAPTVGKLFASTPLDLLSPQAGFAWNVFGDGKTVVRSGFGIYRDQLAAYVFGAARFLAPFFDIEEFVLPQFLNPQNAAEMLPVDTYATTYRPKFPYALEYNLNVERELAQGMILSAGYFGTRGNHLTRQAEENPFEPALGTRLNPNLPSPLLVDLTDGQSFYNSFQVSVSRRYTRNLSWQMSYTLAHSIDDSSVDFNVESVNDPPISQNTFDRKGSRGPSDFDVRHNFTANVVYDLPGRGRLLRGWQVSSVVNVHSGLPFTPVLDFDNADIQSLVVPERPNLIGNPYAGVCPSGASVGTPSCWFNPSAFAVPPAGQFGNAGRNVLRGPAFAQFDVTLHKDFAIAERRKFTLGVEAYNLFNHPNFGVPTNTQSAFVLGGSGDAIFKDAAGHFADNAGQILTTVGTGRQIQLTGRFTF